MPPEPEPTPAEVATDTSFVGENFDPNSLPPELQPAYRQMQGHFTRTQQQLKEREKQYEQFGSPDEIAQAIELRTMLSDPRNYAQLHGELTEYLKATGATPAEASAEAHRQLEETQPAAPNLGQYADDPEFAPVKDELTQLRTQLTSIKSDFDSYREQREQQEMELALVGEVQRQVGAIRQNRPDYTDQDIDAIFQLGTFYEGNLMEAQKRYDEIFTDRMSRYLASKQAPAATQGVFGNAGVTTAQPTTPRTWDDARAAALATAAEMDGS